MDSETEPVITRSGQVLDEADLARLAAQAEAGFDLSTWVVRPTTLATLLHNAQIGCFENVDRHPEDGELHCDADHMGAALRLIAEGAHTDGPMDGSRSEFAEILSTIQAWHRLHDPK